MFKNVASQKIQVFAFDYTTGAPKTGDAANITVYVSKDHGAVTVLGDTSATEMDATNAKGDYVFDLTQAETNADELAFSGKSSTANVAIVPRFISTLPANLNLLSIDGSGRVDVGKITGTAQTARDIGASVLLSAGTGAGQLDFTSGVVKSNLVQILATALTETAGQIAGGFKKVFDVAAPVFTALSVNQTGDNYARIGAPAGASVSADIAAIKSDTGTILTDVNTGAGAIYTRLGAPAGASLAADIAALPTAAIVKTQVVNALTSDTYAEPGAVPAATSSLKDKIGYLFAKARNKLTQTATTQLVRNDADNATIATITVSDDGTTFTKGKDS